MRPPAAVEQVDLVTDFVVLRAKAGAQQFRHMAAQCLMPRPSGHRAYQFGQPVLMPGHRGTMGGRAGFAKAGPTRTPLLSGSRVRTSSRSVRDPVARPRATQR